MTEDLRIRLAAAAESAREYEHVTARAAELRFRRERLARTLEERYAALASERADVAKLEGVSITRILAAIGRDREERLDRERAEAEAAALRVAEAESRLAAIDADIEDLRMRRLRLGDAPQAFARLLDETERALVAAGEEGVARLVAERGQVAADLKETHEALRAAGRAIGSLDAALSALNSASGWSTYDTFFGGGALSSAIKHDRLDDAWRAAAAAEHQLAVLNAELADVPGMPSLTAQLHVSTTSRMIDIWFDNIFTDLAIRDKIKNSQASVSRARDAVAAVHERLAARVRRDEARLVELDAARRATALGE